MPAPAPLDKRRRRTSFRVMTALPELPADQVEAALRALRSLGERLTPGVAPPPSVPFSRAAELDAVQALIEATLDGAPAGTLERLLATVTGDERMARYPAEIRRIEMKLYRDALVRRGERPAPANPVARRESDQARLQTYRFVLSHFLGAIPDDQLISANRKAYARWLELEPLEGDPGVGMDRFALQLEMDMLAAVMDASGVTDRFMAGLPTGQAN